MIVVVINRWRIVTISNNYIDSIQFNIFIQTHKYIIFKSTDRGGFLFITQS